MGVVIKAFRTPLGCYVYDRGSHTIIRVPETQYPLFLKLEAGKADGETADILEEYRAKGGTQGSEDHAPADTKL